MGEGTVFFGEGMTFRAGEGERFLGEGGVFFGEGTTRFGDGGGRTTVWTIMIRKSNMRTFRTFCQQGCAEIRGADIWGDIRGGGACVIQVANFNNIAIVKVPFRVPYGVLARRIRFACIAALRLRVNTLQFIVWEFLAVEVGTHAALPCTRVWQRREGMCLLVPIP